ncbi:hypothetical protein [Pseudomonas guariconensis]|uniref:hypothetical protein n=1 Tax=Pseudomonas guariconensis TaxID=1288410 RepID=UPI0018A9837B|nr:hypothetical protein [Pseudomonas guariconensis]MBF8739518.1 hypothetical protein [Pseudomonas guariconensis]MBF8749921.1 hypothetical protein [Pseudomonas guariconensis]
MSADKIIKAVAVAAGAIAVSLGGIFAGKFASDHQEKKRRKKLDEEHAMLEKKLNGRSK